MPDAFGLPTGQEITHYEDVLKKATDAVGTMRENPFDRAKFEEARKNLQISIDSMKNPHIWGNSTGHTPLFGFPGHLKNIVDQGITTVSLPSLQGELQQANDNLITMKRANKQNPMKNVLSYFLNKRN